MDARSVLPTCVRPSIAYGFKGYAALASASPDTCSSVRRASWTLLPCDDAYFGNHDNGARDPCVWGRRDNGPERLASAIDGLGKAKKEKKKTDIAQAREEGGFTGGLGYFYPSKVQARKPTTRAYHVAANLIWGAQGVIFDPMVIGKTIF